MPHSSGSKIRVLVVDDSAIVRRLLSEILEAAGDIEVVGGAEDPYAARDLIKQLNPDVLTLDVEMPRMDGITFLKNLMRLRPMPVVMVSTLTQKGADVTLEALSIGAVDFVAKPKVDVANQLAEYGEELIDKVRAAASARLKARPARTEDTGALPTPLAAVGLLKRGDPRDLIAIGASTGGTEAIKDVLTALPENTPGVVIAQHIPAEFSLSFAQRMDRVTGLRVKEAEEGDVVRAGHVYIAPGSHHLVIERKGGVYVCHLDDGPRVNRHRPSVDVLFRSVAACAGKHALGILLTGMGKDGAQGLLEMREAGAHTICQDELTSVVWGMPGEGVKLGAAEAVLPLNRIANAAMAQFARRAGS